MTNIKIVRRFAKGNMKKVLNLKYMTYTLMLVYLVVR